MAEEFAVRQQEVANMDNSSDRELTMIYGRRFGRIAMSMGFVNLDQVQEALAEQLTSNSFTRLRPHKLIGEILFEKGWMDLNQIEKVLDKIT